LTLRVQNKSVVIWLKVCQLHLETAGLFVGHSRNSGNG